MAGILMLRSREDRDQDRGNERLLDVRHHLFVRSTIMSRGAGNEQNGDCRSLNWAFYTLAVAQLNKLCSVWRGQHNWKQRASRYVQFPGNVLCPDSWKRAGNAEVAGSKYISGIVVERHVCAKCNLTIISQEIFLYFSCSIQKLIT